MKSMMIFNYFTIILLILFGFNEAMRIISNQLMSNDNVYSVVIDAGSSGTKLNVYHFKIIPNELVLQSSSKIKSKLPISIYSKNCENWLKIKMMLQSLIDKAKTLIPTSSISTTSIYLQATSGVRNMDKVLSNSLLTYIKHFFIKSGFKFQNHNVGILALEEEGRMGWISINYLLKQLFSTQNHSTFGSMDLGGGSTQIAFESSSSDLSSNIEPIIFPGKNFSVYSKGYEKRGIDEVRLKYLRATNCINRNCEGKIMRSVCINEHVLRNFTFGKINFKLGGKEIDNEKRFDYCVKEAGRAAGKMKSVTSYLENKSIVGMSAFYYILNGAGILQQSNISGLFTTTVRDIRQKTKEICNSPPNPTDPRSYLHLQCIDLTYIMVILSDKYGYPYDFPLYFSAKIQNIDLSWTIGFGVVKTLSNF